MFGATEGVIQTSVGYAGGIKKHPTYQDLGDHTEVVRVIYDPTEIDYKQLLSIFRNNHNPSMHYQRQYWSIILYTSEKQLISAQECLQFLEKASSSTIHTKLVPFEKFIPAESYHQKYILQTHPWMIVAVNVQSAKELIESQICTKLNGFLAGYGRIDEFFEVGKRLGLNEKMITYVSNELKKSAVHTELL